jgi:hypothetical protein
LRATARLRLARVPSPTRVKTLLGVAVADNDDTCGCHFLFGGVFLGRTIPPLSAKGNPRFALPDRPTAALWCRLLLEGVALAARVLRLLEMVASQVLCETGLCGVSYCSSVRLRGAMHAIIRTLRSNSLLVWLDPAICSFCAAFLSA